MNVYIITGELHKSYYKYSIISIFVVEIHVYMHIRIYYICV